MVRGGGERHMAERDHHCCCEHQRDGAGRPGIHDVGCARRRRRAAGPAAGPDPRARRRGGTGPRRRPVRRQDGDADGGLLRPRPAGTGGRRARRVAAGPGLVRDGPVGERDGAGDRSRGPRSLGRECPSGCDSGVLQPPPVERRVVRSGRPAGFLGAGWGGCGAGCGRHGERHRGSGRSDRSLRHQDPDPRALAPAAATDRRDGAAGLAGGPAARRDGGAARACPR